jgi:lipopolysaccharide transport system permease protein
MNPHAAYPIKPGAMVDSLWQHRQLIAGMTYREIVGRYKGSVLGIFWSLAHPLFMLVLYTLVFSGVFNARLSLTPEQSHSEFALILFTGLILHGFFAEVLGRAPLQIISNPNYVKKIIFPLQILPVINTGAALFHGLVSLIVLVTGIMLMRGQLPLSAAYLPLVLLPFILLTLGLAWLLSSLGVYLRDIGQGIGMLMTVLLFASPVFYPLSALPQPMQKALFFNPLTVVIEQTRRILMDGQPPQWDILGIYSLIAFVSAWAGYAWFQKTRKGFANVL